MNNKMTTNYNYQQMNLKTKIKTSKQLDQEQNHRNGDHMDGYQWGGVGEEWGGGTGKKKHN